MPELFIELFSEEIPARLQGRAAQELARAVGEALTALSFHGERVFFGPRRIALAATVSAGTQATTSVERGPRVAAPEQALAGFLRKHGAAREALRQEGDFWVLDRATAAVDAASLVAAAMPGLLRRFAWPKSMRWGAGSAFAWIRPLRRIVCLLDGAVVPFSLAQGEDDGHGLASSNMTEGHRMHGPCAIEVTSVADWQDKLFTHRVMAKGRAPAIWHGVTQRAAEKGVVAVEDAGLLDEVAGLVEWPVPLLGRIDDAFMDLPPEVMQVSMRVNQRYFATRTRDGAPAPWFAFAANLEAPDGGAAIVAGNERVLRARFADARHFWDLDRRTKLADRVAALDGVTFQAELGSQGDRVRRLVRLAGAIAPMVGADAALAERAALLCKADLTTGMVGEFPELQGVMGGYYAAHDGEDARVAAAVGAHYAPRGPTDTVPSAPVTVVVALADKLDQLAAFFSIGQQPTGSGDPFGLRRAALGLIRLVRENRLRINFDHLFQSTIALLPPSGREDEHGWEPVFLKRQLLNFVGERVRVQFKGEGGRSDILLAVMGADRSGDFIQQIDLAYALSDFLTTPDGVDLLAAYKRATNILRIEETKDGSPFGTTVDERLFETHAEHDLQAALDQTEKALSHLDQDQHADAMTLLAALRQPLDSFFNAVMVNAPDAAIRRNRLSQLTRMKLMVRSIAEFSVIEMQ